MWTSYRRRDPLEMVQLVPGRSPRPAPWCGSLVGERLLDRVQSFMSRARRRRAYSGARGSRDSVCTALMPESTLSTYIVCSSGSWLTHRNFSAQIKKAVRILPDPLGDVAEREAIDDLGRLGAAIFVLALRARPRRRRWPGCSGSSTRSRSSRTAWKYWIARSMPVVATIARTSPPILFSGLVAEDLERLVLGRGGEGEVAGIGQQLLGPISRLIWSSSVSSSSSAP